MKKTLTQLQAQKMMRLHLASLSVREIAITLHIPYMQCYKEIQRIKDLAELLGIDTSPRYSIGEYILYLEQQLPKVTRDKVLNQFPELFPDLYKQEA